MTQPSVHPITAPALAAALAGDPPPLLLDVREPQEIAIAQIAGALNIPLGQLAQRFETLDAQTPVVVMCHHGGRSMHAASFLAAQGFAHVSNLTGGIEAWSLQVDRTIPRY